MNKSKERDMSTNNDTGENKEVKMKRDEHEKDDRNKKRNKKGIKRNKKE